MEKVDDYIIDLVQKLYDPLWDNLGATKGFLSMLVKFLCIFIIFFSDIRTSFNGIWCGALMALAYKNYVKIHIPQANGNFKDLNKTALECRSSMGQKVKLYLIFPVFIVFISLASRAECYSVMSVLIMLMFSLYFTTILIRDREPAEPFLSFKGV